MRYVGILLSIALCATGFTADAPPLRLLNTIPLPNVTGRFDHSAVDVNGKRMFVTGRDANTIEVVDLAAGKYVQTLSGFPQPQGAYYVAAVKKLFVSTRDDGTCKILSGDTLKVIDTLKLSVGANVIAYDSGAKLLYIGHGGKQVGDAPDQKRGPGQIAIIDAIEGKEIGNIETDPELRPGAIVVEQNGNRLFTTNALGSHIVIIDRKTRTVIAKWQLPNAERSGTIALDEARHRLFVGMRNPSKIIVLNSDSGEQVATFPTVDGIDRLLYDPASMRLYASGSAKTGDHQGAIKVYRQMDANHYELLTTVPTGPDGGVSLLVPETGQLYITVPKAGNKSAEIRVYSTR